MGKLVFEHLKTYGKHYAAIAFFALSLSLNILLYTKNVDLTMERRIIGTFMVGTQPEDYRYLVFDNEGCYCIYTPWALLEKGTYQKGENGIYALTVDNGEAKGVVFLNEKVYVYDDQHIDMYSRLENFPMYNTHVYVPK